MKIKRKRREWEKNQARRNSFHHKCQIYLLFQVGKSRQRGKKRELFAAVKKKNIEE